MFLEDGNFPRFWDLFWGFSTTGQERLARGDADMEYDFRSAVTTLYRQSPNAFSVTAEDPVMAPRLLRISRIP